MPKTPYEVRLETLQLATSIVSARWAAANEGPPTKEIIQEALILRNFIDSDGTAAIVDESSPERRIFFVELGDLDTTAVTKVVEEIKERFKKPVSSEDARQAVEGNGEIPLPEPIQAESPLKMIEDYFFTQGKAQSKTEFLEQLKSDGSACCGGAGGDACECNLPDNNTTGC